MFRQNTEKYKTFTFSIEKKVTKIDNNGEEITKNISYILQFIDSVRFMASSFSNLVNNLSEGTHKFKCKYGHDNKNCETCGITYEICHCFLEYATAFLKIKYKYCDCFLEYTNFKDDLIEYKCLFCNKNYQQKFNENTYKCFTHDSNKYILLLPKVVYPREYRNIIT